MFKRWILFDPENDDKGGGGGGGDDKDKDKGGTDDKGGADDKAAPTVDLSSTIKLEDGTVVTVKDLVDARTQASQATARNKELEKDLGHVRTLFSEDASADQRASSVRHILKQQGYTDEQAEAYLQMTGLTESKSGAGEGEGDAGGGEGSSDVEKALLETQQQVQKLEAGARAARTEGLKRDLDRELEQVLDTDGAVKLLLDKTAEMRGEGKDEKEKEVRAQARATIKGQLHRQTLENLQVRKAREGQLPKEMGAWFKEESRRAVKPVLEAFQSVIGDLDKLGRTPETVTGGESDLLSRDPVKRPEYDEEKSVSQIEQDITSWQLDTLQRAAATGAATGGSKV